MPAKLPNDIKSLAIREWLQGKTRDEIATDNGLSAGATTNIINEWRQGLGLMATDEPRQFAITLRKTGITIAQCALGFRVAMTMINLGVKEDDFHSFILEIYNRCKDLPLSPNDITAHLNDLFEFSKTVPLSKITDFIKQKGKEKYQLEEDVKRLNEEVELLKIEESDLIGLRDVALKNYEMTSDELEWISNIKEELRKYRISLDDISVFAKLVNGIKQTGYDVNKVINEFVEIDKLIVQKNVYQQQGEYLENKVKELKYNVALLNKISVHMIRYSQYIITCATWDLISNG